MANIDKGQNARDKKRHVPAKALQNFYLVLTVRRYRITQKSLAKQK